MRISPSWTWSTFWIVAAMLVVTIVAMVAFPIEISSRGRGVIRPADGIRTLTVQTGGTVSTIPLRSGDWVTAGQVLMTFDAASIQAQLLEADRQVAMLDGDFRSVSARQASLHAQQEAMLNQRLAMLAEQIASQERSIDFLNQKLKANEVLFRSELVSRITVEESREAVSQGQQLLNTTRQSMAATRQELAALSSRRQGDMWRGEQDLKQAIAKRDSLQFSMAQTTIIAPESGVLESVLVKRGDVIQAGQTFGRIVPNAATFRIIAFLPERDHAFVKVGDMVRLEVDRYPYGEYGTIAARIVRISGDVASMPEYAEAFGDSYRQDSACYRVELDPESVGAGATTWKSRLANGMLVQARFTVRRQRPIALLFEPLRRWLD